MVGPPGGGTINVVSPDKSFWGHMGHDVLPWFACCKLTDSCGRYYERRPSDRGLRYDPPKVGKFFFVSDGCFHFRKKAAFNFLHFKFGRACKLNVARFAIT
jgi:hypothetical protein